MTQKPKPTAEQTLALAVSIYMPTLLEGSNNITNAAKQLNKYCEEHQRKFHRRFGRKEYQKTLNICNTVWDKAKSEFGAILMDVEPYLIQMYWAHGETICKSTMIHKIDRHYQTCMTGSEECLEVVSAELTDRILEITYEEIGYVKKKNPLALKAQMLKNDKILEGK